MRLGAIEFDGNGRAGRLVRFASNPNPLSVLAILGDRGTVIEELSWDGEGVIRVQWLDGSECVINASWLREITVLDKIVEATS